MEEEEVDQKSDCISVTYQSAIKTNQRRKGGMSRTKHYTTHKTWHCHFLTCEERTCRVAILESVNDSPPPSSVKTWCPHDLREFAHARVIACACVVAPLASTRLLAFSHCHHHYLLCFLYPFISISLAPCTLSRCCSGHIEFSLYSCVSGAKYLELTRIKTIRCAGRKMTSGRRTRESHKRH